MRDIDFILQTMREIGAVSLSCARKDAILAAAIDEEPEIRDELDQAFRRHAIVRETLRAFGHRPDNWRDVYANVFIACRNLRDAGAEVRGVAA